MIGQQTAENRLRSRRIPFSRQVVVSSRSDIDVRFEASFDLSLGGMFITTMMPLDAGEVVDIDLSLAPVPLRGPAKVVWTRTSETGKEQPAGMAVEFVGLTPNQKRLVLRQITDHTRSGGQLKIGEPPKAEITNVATTTSGGRSTTVDRELPGRRPVPSRFPPLLVGGAAAIIIATLLLILLL